jgi:DNA-binding beta-propeller fold protein YncE
VDLRSQTTGTASAHQAAAANCRPATAGVRGLSRRTKIALIAGAVAVVAVIAAAVAIPAILGHRSHSAQVVLPFTGLSDPFGVAVDAAGSLYVTDFKNRVVKLAAGSNTQTVLPFTGLHGPYGVAVDSAGNLYVTDYGNNRVLKLPVQ